MISKPHKCSFNPTVRSSQPATFQCSIFPLKDHSPSAVRQALDMPSLKICLEKKAYKWMGYLIQHLRVTRNFGIFVVLFGSRKYFEMAIFLWNEHSGFQPTLTNKKIFNWLILSPAPYISLCCNSSHTATAEKALVLLFRRTYTFSFASASLPFSPSGR